jgi:hypothetical protein
MTDSKCATPEDLQMLDDQLDSLRDRIQERNNAMCGNTDSVIYKYPLRFDERFIIELPVFSQVLSVQVQDGLPKIWVLRPRSNDDLVNYVFSVIGTGNPIPACNAKNLGTFVGTFQHQGFVFHLFVNNRTSACP